MVSNMSNYKTLLCTMALTVSGLLAQAPGAPPLIRLYPIVTDATTGQPVTDVTAADFKIVDQGKPETILFFHKPVTGPTAPLAALEHSNRAGGPPHSIAILFDLMNENQNDRIDNWHMLSKTLPELESGKSIYFYLLNLEGELVPIHAISPGAADDESWPKDAASVLDKAMKIASHGRPVHMGQEDQVKSTFHQLEVLGTSLAVFPGRRDIVWITDGMQNVYNPKLPCNSDWVDCALYVPHLGFTLASAQVAVDPVSYSRDLTTAVNPMMQMDTPSHPNAGAPTNATTALGDYQQHNVQGSQGGDPGLDLTQMALLTGGRSFFRTEFRGVLKEIAADESSAFEIAYDPTAENWDAKWHRIHVTCEKPGLKVQVRERYYADAGKATPIERMKAALMGAFQSPADAADIGLRTKIAPLADKPGVHMDVRINPSDLLLREQNGKFTGSIYLLISDRSATAPLGEPTVANYPFDLTAAQHDAVMKEGIPIPLDHPTTGAVDGSVSSSSTRTPMPSAPSLSR